MAAIPPSGGWTGRSVPRVEEAALLTGRGRYMDDLPIAPGTLHAAILRSPRAHAISSVSTPPPRWRIPASPAS